MIEHRKNVPTLRFEGFCEEWEEKKLGELITSLQYGLNAPAIEFDGKNKYIRITDIDEESRLFIEENITSPDIDLSNAENYLLSDGELLFARTGASVGKSFLYKKSSGRTFFAGFLIRAVVSDKINPSFIYQNTLTKKYYDFVLITSQRTGQPGINAKEYASYSLFIPKLTEQTQIGNFFKQLDETIELHQQELNKHKDLKKAYLTKMFPKDGEKVPELRFEGFSGGWEEHELGNIAKITMGQSPSSKNYTNNSNHYILVQGNSDFENGKVSPKVWTTEITKLAFAGDLIISVRAPVGDIGITDYDIVLGRGVASIKGNNFVFFYLEKLKMIGYWDRISSGSTFESINSKDLSCVFFLVPNLKEQTAIGNFFKQLDETIDLQQQELDKYKNLKKAYLAMMFI